MLNGLTETHWNGWSFPEQLLLCIAEMLGFQFPEVFTFYLKFLSFDTYTIVISGFYFIDSQST